MPDHADELNQQARAWKSTVIAMSADDHLERAATHLANADMCRSALREREDAGSASAAQIDQLRTSEIVFLYRAQIHASLAAARPSRGHGPAPVSSIPAQVPTPFLA